MIDALTYRLEQFEGPLDLLLTLVHKNKMNIEDIPISILCDQYLEYIKAAEDMDMELAGEFIVMASELMLIKSRMLLPRATEDEKDPRADLAEALMRFEQAKRAVAKMTPLYQQYSGRMVKDTDEISIDTTYVADQQVTSLCAAVRRIIAANESRPRAEKQVFAPMIAKPIVPVEVKIVGILHHIDKKRNPSMKELLSDATSLPDLIAIFLGILELIKVRKILIEEDEDSYTVIHGTDTRFVVNDEPPAPEGEEPKKPRSYEGEPIPLSSKAEMHREQRRIIREQKLAEKKRLREEARARRAEERRLAKEAALAASATDSLPPEEELPPDDSDLEEEARMAELIDNQLSEDDEDLLDDIGLDMNEIIGTMAKRAQELSANPDTKGTDDL